MATKPVKTEIKLQIPGAEASPAPPVGPTLGEHGVPIGEFVNRFNAKTQDQPGVLLPVEITVFADNSFEMTIKSPPASYLLKEAAGIVKGSPEPHDIKVGAVLEQDLREIAERKMEDLNARDLDEAQKIIKGSAESMGIEVFETEEEAEEFRETEVVEDIDEVIDTGPEEEEEGAVEGEEPVEEEAGAQGEPAL